jgi:3-(3-hydroxy-phenyl)propionate hydroxylase
MATEEGAWSVLRRWIGPDDATLWRQASYRFHALVAREWRAGRVFIAGDAAHQQPPFLGQGMCQGVRDVVNLTWKLRRCWPASAGQPARHLHGGAARTRAPAHHAHQGDRRRHLRARPRTRAGARRRPDRRGRRRHPHGAAPGHHSAADGGLLASGDRAGAGTLFPQPRVHGPTGPALLDELAGAGWRIVTDLRTAQLPPGLLALAERLGMLISIPSDTAGFSSGPHRMQADELDGVLARWFAKHGCRAAVVRPDHYVYGVADDGQELYDLVAGLMNLLQS